MGGSVSRNRQRENFVKNPAILLLRVNPYCTRAMEGAAPLCQTRAHAEIL